MLIYRTEAKKLGVIPKPPSPPILLNYVQPIIFVKIQRNKNPNTNKTANQAWIKFVSMEQLLTTEVKKNVVPSCLSVNTL